jgi:hypothetical protein
MSEVVVKQSITGPALVEALKAERDAAWHAFNPHFPPSQENDWVRFALANSRWLAAYTRLHGHEPEPDSIEEAARTCYNARRHGGKQEVAAPRTDEERSKTNERRRVK